MADRPHAGHAVGPIRLEAAKIVSPPQAFRGTPHGIGIQRMPALMTISAQERIGRRAVVDHIPIKLALGIAVGIKRLRHVRCLANHDIGRQMSIQSSNEYVGGMLGCCVEVNDLADRVNAGVGSPAGVGMRSLTGERRNGGFQSLLNGSKPRLCLPAEEVGAIVAQGQLNVAHRTAQDSSFHPPRQDPLRQMVRKSPEMFVFLEDFDPLRQFHLLAEGVWSAKMLHLVAFLAFRQLLPLAECPGLSAAGQPVALDQDFGDLHGVAGRPFAKIVRDHPEIEPVRHGWIPADPADKNFVPADGVES